MAPTVKRRSRITASPGIHRVPDEVLQEIFLLCLPAYTWRTSLAPSECPVVLTHVCRRWRNASFAFPRLWKSLKLDVLRIRFDKTVLGLWSAAIARARPSPRCLQLIIRTRGWFRDKKHRDALHPIPSVAGLLGEPCTTSSLTRLVLRGVPVRHLHSVPSGSFPSLVDLVLNLPGTDLDRFPWARKGPVEAFSEAPALRRVALKRSPSIDDVSGPAEIQHHVSTHVALPWAQLTHLLDFDALDEPPFVPPHLSECESLQYLFVALSEDLVGPEGFLNRAGRPAVPLPSVQSLTLYFWAFGGGEVGYPALIDAFTFPNLQALRIEGSAFDFNDDSLNIWSPAPLVDRFLERVEGLRCLTYLSLCVSSVPRDTLRRVLRATPSVTTLDSLVYENYEHFFEGLTWGVERLLPKLETLLLELDNSVAIDDGEGYTIDPGPFAEFLESRVGNDECKSFRRVVVFSESEEAWGDEVPFVEVALRYVPKGLVFEKRLAEERATRHGDNLWMDRDPWLRDWPELVESG